MVEAWSSQYEYRYNSDSYCYLYNIRAFEKWILCYFIIKNITEYLYECVITCTFDEGLVFIDDGDSNWWCKHLYTKHVLHDVLLITHEQMLPKLMFIYVH